MKILYLSNAQGYGGSERSVEFIAPELARNCSLKLIVENEIHAHAVEIMGLSFRRSRAGKNPVLIFVELIRLAHELSSCDVVIANTNKAAFFLALLAKANLLPRRVTKVVFIRDFQWKHTRFIVDCLYDARYCIPSMAVIKHISKYLSQAHVIPDPVIKIFDVDNGSLSCADGQYPLILCPAAISRWKGIDFLIRAAARLKLPCSFLVIGNVIDAEYFNELQILINELGIEHIFEFKPFAHDIDDYYARSTLVVNCSISNFGGPETFGRTIVEAWSWGKPVIAFDCGGPSYLIEHGVDGLLVPEGDVEGLSESILKLIDDPSACSSMGANGLRKAQENYLVGRVVEKLLKVIGNDF